MTHAETALTLTGATGRHGQSQAVKPLSLTIARKQGVALIPILTTIGLGAALQNGMFGLFGSETRSLGAYIGNLSWASWQLPVYMFLTAIVVLGALHLLLTRTAFGRAVRATSTDPDAAALCGTDARKVHRWAAAIAVALAALAGIFLALRAQVTPSSGPMLLIFAFEAVVIGGIGPLRGTLIESICLGVAQVMGRARHRPQPDSR